ncbi:MAG TPA: hypothetical protein VFJ24_06830 [Gaiellales bacterium]|nr:hypothetical protein [Gaiellales bacterium]
MTDGPTGAAQPQAGAAAAAGEQAQAASETFSATLDSVIGAIVNGVASAQAAIDRNSLASQQAIDANPELAGKDLQAPWYQLARTDVQLKLAFTVAEAAGAQAQPATAAAPAAIPATPIASPAMRLIAQPVSAAYQNHFNFNAQASSTVTLSLAPVPPPQPPSGAVATPQLTQEEVQALALQSDAGFATQRGPKGTRVPSAKLRFGMQYNPSARIHYVHQYKPGELETAAVAAIDDVTREVRVIQRRS